MSKEADEQLKELRAIKMLMVLQLIRQGVKQSQIAALLGVSEATMSRMLPKGVSKALSKASAGVKLEGD